MADESIAAAAEAAPTDGGGIKTASEVIEKVLAMPDAKAPNGKPAPKEPTRRVEKLEAKAIAAEPAPDEAAAASERAKYYLRHGDLAKAIDAAFGDLSSIDASLPDGVREALARKLNVSSAQWEKIRKHEQATKRGFQEREQKLSTIIHNLQQEYAPLHTARQAYANGDYETAFKQAFGEEAADFQRKVISQRIGKNPDVERLRAELEQERAQQRAWAEQQRQQQAQAAEQQAIHGYIADIGRELSQSDDTAVRKYSTRPAFVHRVFEIQRANYDAQTNTTIPLTVAAEAARDEILNSLKDWRIEEEQSGNAAQAVRTGAPSVKSPAGRPPVRVLKQTGAADASGSKQKLTSAQIRDKYQRIMEG